MQVVKDNLVQANVFGAITYLPHTRYRAAISWAANVFRIAVTGFSGVELLSGEIPELTRLEWGRQDTGLYLDGHLCKGIYEPRLSTLAALEEWVDAL